MKDPELMGQQRVQLTNTGGDMAGFVNLYDPVFVSVNTVC